MSYEDYKLSQGIHIAAKLGQGDVSFYALLGAALRAADTENVAKITLMWPELARDVTMRYNAPGGVLDTDPDEVKLKVWGQLENPRA